MDAISDGPQTLKFVHTHGAGLHGTETDPDVNDPRWQRRQVEDFVQFAVEAEELGFDGVTVTEHHAPLMTCPSPHLLLAAAAVKTSRIRLGTAVTVLPLYNPVRVAEEAGTLDLLSGGRFELGLGRGVPGEALFAVGRDLSPDELNQGWAESLELLHLALTGRDFTFNGAFHKVTRPTTIATRPLQDPLPVWLGGSSLSTMGRAAERGWSIMRNFGSNAEHRDALDHYVKVAAEHGYARTGANMMIERFVATGDTTEEAERNLAKLAGAFGRFLSLYTAGGRRPVPQTDAEFHVDGAGATPNRPAIAVAGIPDQLIEELQQVLDETGSRRLLVELFSARERRMFMDEVAPALRERYGTRVLRGMSGTSGTRRRAFGGVALSGGVPLGGVASDARRVNRELPGTATAAQRGVLERGGLGVLRLVRVPRGDGRVVCGRRVFLALASHNPGLSHSPGLWHNPCLSAGPAARHQGCPPAPP
ncbi:MAG TPA: LLM class flavin-dependent oxidoreductase [Trebonia sp.]